MAGRHGPDQLSITLTIVSFVITLFFAPRGLGRWFLLVAYALLGWAVFRILSRNHSKRFEENQRFLVLWNAMKGRFQKGGERVRMSSQYHFYTCPQCGQRLRVPRGKGKLEISCPKCGKNFVKKT